MDENTGRISGGGGAAHHDVGVAALLEVRIEDRLAGRASAPLPLQQVDTMEVTGSPHQSTSAAILAVTPQARVEVWVDLTRFRGHRTTVEGGVHDGNDAPNVPAGVPAPDGRAGPGRTWPEELAREFEPSSQAIRNWVDQAEQDGGRRDDGLTGAEREELSRLRREVRQLRPVRAILAKAAARFARETGSIPSGSSSP